MQSTSIERVADHAVGISSKHLRLNQKLTKDAFDKIQKMSQFSLSVLSDSVEAFLRRDYVLADSVVNKAEEMRNLEADVISFLDRQNGIGGRSANVDIKIILEDIRRTAEHASDIAESNESNYQEVIQVRAVPQREKEKTRPELSLRFFQTIIILRDFLSPANKSIHQYRALMQEYYFPILSNFLI